MPGPVLGGIGARFRAIREGHRRPDGSPLPQADFARLMQAAAARLYGDQAERVYGASVINRFENEGQSPTLKDIAVYATLDREHRGKLWLGWGERVDATVRAPRLGPSIIQENDDAVFDEPNLPERRPARKRRRGA